MGCYREGSSPWLDGDGAAGLETTRREAFFLIADITGYTRFLTRTELEHADAVLTALFRSLLSEVRPPLRFGNIQGDALLLHLPRTGAPQAGEVLDAIARLYRAFTGTLRRIEQSPACAARPVATWLRSTSKSSSIAANMSRMRSPGGNSSTVST